MVSATRPVRHRFLLLGWSFLLMLLSIPATVFLAVLLTAGFSLLLVWVGIPVLLGGIALVRRFADLHRLFFARALDVRIPRPYRIPPAGSRPSRLSRLLALAREPATWRDLWWLLVNGTVGYAAVTLVVALFGSFLWYGSLPLLWAILDQAAGAPAEDVLRTDFGLWAIDRQSRSWAGIPIGLGFLLLWWWLTPPVLRGYARLSATLLGPGRSTLAARVRQLTESRAETVDAQAAELRRIERDLHDGAQARLVSLGMSLGMAEELLDSDPAAAARLLAEAREGSGRALVELRELVRGMHPPVLADRGLPGAVQALALAHPLPVEVVDRLPGRLPAPVESAGYFAIAEALTNIGKHAGAGGARVRLGYREAGPAGAGRLQVTVSDDGHGGAQEAAGGGLAGIRRRLSAFDGTMTLTSPTGGPTVLTMEIPCELVAGRSSTDHPR